MRLRSALGWTASIALAVGLCLGLDPYQRLPLDYGYGPDRRVYFAETLRSAKLLEEEGEFSVAAPARWHLVGQWTDSDDAPPRTSQRRATFVLPLLRPAPLTVEIEVIPLLGAVEVELGVNGAAVERASVPAGGDFLWLVIPE
ncbi:MAG: hypothetical protein ACRD21_01190 [Vicinamibacteria bacterium]